MPCGDIYQSDLRSFDSWLQEQIMGQLKTPGIATEVFLMSWNERLIVFVGRSKRDVDDVPLMRSKAVGIVLTCNQLEIQQLCPAVLLDFLVI
jgi:hypothetical protein